MPTTILYRAASHLMDQVQYRQIKIRHIVSLQFNTEVFRNLAKNFNVNFRACVKIAIGFEWEIGRMREN